MSGASKPSPTRRRYNATVVRTLLVLQKELVRLRITDLLYFLAGLPVATLVWLGIYLPNRIEIRGLEHVPPPGTGFFLLSNHISMAEAPVMATRFFPRAFWFPSKAEFYKGWLSGIGYLLVTAMHTFPVRRGERDTQAIDFMQELLRRGKNVLLFPEGTRSKDGQLLPGKKGVGMIVHSAQALVVPVYVRGFDRIWPPGSLLPRLGRGQALISFAPPMDLSRWWDEPFGRITAQGIVDEVMAEIARLKAEDEAQAA